MPEVQPKILCNKLFGFFILLSVYRTFKINENLDMHLRKYLPTILFTEVHLMSLNLPDIATESCQTGKSSPTVCQRAL